MSRFDYFVVFAEMRTGSNFLEANINAFDGLQCHGEAFNPHFIGYPNTDDILGVRLGLRQADPEVLIDAIKEQSDGLGGFRFFNDHDQRVLDVVLPDPRCAKIILTRNPVESYVSWKIAQATGQWKLTNVKHAKSEKVSFEPAEFETHLAALQAFQVRLLNALQRSGQTAFYVAYEDLQDVDIMNGLAAFLECDDRLEHLDKKLKKQNPAPMSDKVSNFDDMAQSLARMDRFNLARTPNFEPRRGPAVPTYIACAQSPLLYMPLKSGPELAVQNWMAAIDQVDPADLKQGFTQKTLRQWKRKNTGHRSFAVLRHPLVRAHAAFCDRILSTDKGSFTEIRETLRREFKLPYAKGKIGDGYDTARHQEAFLGFLRFLKANLAGQTSIRVDANWASQASILSGMSEFVAPDFIMREETLERDCQILGDMVGLPNLPKPDFETDPHLHALESIHNDDLDAAIRDVYQRDFMMFGFDDWRA